MFKITVNTYFRKKAKTEVFEPTEDEVEIYRQAYEYVLERYFGKMDRVTSITVERI